ncbi:hypothetical protein [Mycobacterium tilburgii]|uniref:hypothetical protein n=1 Tax=Mycobacterium tilburgii TaxID=44467 RepID=UPI0021B18A0F|nr:hypothetical protein [Mycobacterium tilburgii]
MLMAGSRLDQGWMRAAVDAVFTAHPDLGTVCESRLNVWTTRPGGGWSWGVEPPGGSVEDVLARQLASFDMHTGRLFAGPCCPATLTGWCSPPVGCASTNRPGCWWSVTYSSNTTPARSAREHQRA